jgi:DNA-binding MarR family transcriptional regulator
MFRETWPSLCACANLRRASRAVCHLYDLVLAPTGIRITQFIILNVIYEAGEVAHCDLARLFAASEETFSRRLASARRSGWVLMREDDRRRRVYCLTEKGRQLRDSALPYWERAQNRLSLALGDRDWNALSDFADRLTEAAMLAEVIPATNGRLHAKV